MTAPPITVSGWWVPESHLKAQRHHYCDDDGVSLCRRFHYYGGKMSKDATGKNVCTACRSKLAK